MAQRVANPTDTLAERITARGMELAPAEQRVAEQLLGLGPHALLLSAAALAEQLGTSDATIVRTAKALGYSGLAEFRRALAAQPTEPPLRERLHRTLEHASGDELFESVLRDHLAALDTLTRNVSPAVFRDAAAILARADRIVWRGVGPSAQLAHYGQLMTQRIGKPSTALVQTGTSFADELLSTGSGDAIVVFAYGRLQSHVRVLLDNAAELDVPVVLVTDNLGRRLAASVAATLQCGRGAPGLFASHGTTLVVVEALVLAVAAAHQAQAEASLTKLNELRSALVGRRIDVDT